MAPETLASRAIDLAARLFDPSPTPDVRDAAFAALAALYVRHCDDSG